MRAKGNKNAPIHITEFIDLECPACARGAEYLARMMVARPEAIRLDLQIFSVAQSPPWFFGGPLY